MIKVRKSTIAIVLLIMMVVGLIGLAIIIEPTLLERNPIPPSAIITQDLGEDWYYFTLDEVTYLYNSQTGMVSEVSKIK